MRDDRTWRAAMGNLSRNEGEQAKVSANGDWPTASCCGEPRVTPDIDACYDHAKLCPQCDTQPMAPGSEACSGCTRVTEAQYRAALREHGIPEDKITELWYGGKIVGLRAEIAALRAERDRLREFVDNLIAGRYFGGGWANKIMDAAKQARDA